MKILRHELRTRPGHLAYVAAPVNALLALNARAAPHDPFPPLRLAQYAL